MINTYPKNSFSSDYFRDIYRGNYLARNPEWKIRFYLDRILKHKPYGALLDIGCAYGLFCKAATSHFTCTGCDVSVHAIAYAAMQSAPKKKRYFVSGLPHLATKGKFDVITCFDVLEHVPDLDSALGMIENLLRDETSILIITVPVYDGIMGKLVGLLDNDPTHIHKESRLFWKNALINRGFEIVDTVGVFRYFLLRKRYLHFGSEALWPVSPAVLLVARKTGIERHTSCL